MLRKFGIFIVRSLIVILVASFIFSFISFDISSILPGLFKDVFVYSSPEAQKDVISKLTSTCSSLQKGDTVISINQVCSNATLLDTLRQNCRDYRLLKKEGKMIENEAKMEESCSEIESENIEVMCSRNKKSIVPDFRDIGKLCVQYGNGELSDGEFFSGALSSPFGGQSIESENRAIKKYNQITDFLHKNESWYYFAIVTLLGLLYLLVWNFEDYLMLLMGICFSLGLMIILPYTIVYLYEKFIGIDTSPVLELLFGKGTINPKSIISVVMLLFLRTYNTLILIIGVILLGIGMSGKGIKIMSHASNNKK